MATRKPVHPPHPPSPPHDLHYDLQVCDVYVREGIDWNPRTPVSVLTTFATDPDECLRRIVAMNPSTPLDVVVRASRDPLLSASHSHTPVGVLTTLATAPEVWVRKAVVANPNTPADILTTLAGAQRRTCAWPWPSAGGCRPRF